MSETVPLNDGKFGHELISTWQDVAAVGGGDPVPTVAVCTTVPPRMKEALTVPPFAGIPQ